MEPADCGKKVRRAVLKLMMLTPLNVDAAASVPERAMPRGREARHARRQRRLVKSADA